MLSPEYLKHLPQQLIKLMEELEAYIIQDIARRIKTSVGEVVTQTAYHQMKAAEEFQLDTDNIQKEIARVTGKGEAEIMALFEDAARECLKYQDKLVEQTAFRADKNSVQQMMNSFREQSLGEFRNITRSLGFADKTGGRIVFKPIARFYQDTLDFAVSQIQTGAADYNTAIRQAVQKLAGSG